MAMRKPIDLRDIILKLLVKMQPQGQEYIQFNQDFDKLVYSKQSESAFAPSPMKGVERMILERRGDQVARRATSIVTYQPGSSFSSHVHTFGEEFYVLQGTFSDQSGDYSKGWYVRNPVKSAHAPFSKEGTKIFVKLGQMPKDQSEYLRLNTNILDFKEISKGVNQLILYESPFQSVFLYNLSQNAVFFNTEKPQISQICIFQGRVQVCGVELQKESWIRIPKNQQYTITALEDSKIYVKIGKGIVRDKDWNELTL